MNVVDNSGLRRYRTELPNMLLDDERIGPYELALFAHYKRRAGDTGACFETNASVARHTNMSVAKVKQARIILAHAGYITIQETTGAPSTITIVDRWGENMSRYGVATTKPPPSKVATSWPGVATTKPGGGYHVATEEEPSKKNQEEEDREDDYDLDHNQQQLKIQRARARKTAAAAAREHDSPPSSKNGDPILAHISDRYTHEIAVSITPLLAESMCEWADALRDVPHWAAAVDYAFIEAAKQGRPRWSYVEAVLSRLQSERWPVNMANGKGDGAYGRRTTHSGDNGGARPAGTASPYGTWADVEAEQRAAGIGRAASVWMPDDDDV